MRTTGVFFREVSLPLCLCWPPRCFCVLRSGWHSCEILLSGLYSKLVVAVDVFVHSTQWSEVLVDKLINNHPHHLFRSPKAQKLIEHFTLLPLIWK